jgi:hypothetical protein
MSNVAIDAPRVVGGKECRRMERDAGGWKRMHEHEG